MRRTATHRRHAQLMLICVALLSSLVSIASAQRVSPVESSIALRTGFVANAGQWSDGARYRMQLGRATAWATDAGFVLDLTSGGGGGHVVRQRFAGARATAPRASQTGPTWTYVHAGSSITAPSYEQLHYREIYPGIDARYYRSGDALKYDLVIAAHASTAHIALQYDGAEGISIASDGSLRIETSAGEIVEEAPVCYQIVGACRVEIPASFEIDGAVVRFRIGDYDHARELVIDPRLAFSTYLGGGANDEGRGIALDGSSNIYIGGSTVSSDIPTTTGAYSRQPDRNNLLELFVVKLDPTASVVLWGTYLGGSGADELTAIAVHSDGAVTLAGTTTSSDFPVTGGADQAVMRGTSDGFVATLSPGGGALRGATFFGGTGSERIEDVAINRNGEPFVVGVTSSSDLATTSGSAIPVARGGGDAFAARFNAGLTARSYATYLGGTGPDHALGIALGSGGAANITGWTASTDFPVTAGAAQGALAGSRDGFIIRLRFNGSLIEYGTYLGGSDLDHLLDIAIDPQGNQYVAGLTFSNDLPQTTGDPPGTWFAARVDSSTGSISTGLGYCRYIGPVHDGAAWTIQASASREAFIAGATNSALFPTTADRLNAGPRGGLDVALVRLSSDGLTIRHASVIGGESDDIPWRQSHLTPYGDLYVTGTTSSARFPTTRNAFDSTLNNNASTSRSDAFALAFRFDPRPSIQSPVRIEFDTVACDTSERDTFEIFNGGDADLVITAHQFARASGRFVLEDPDPRQTVVIPPGTGRRYVVRYRATSTIEAFDTLLVFSNDSLRNPLRIAMHGVRISPDFPNVPTDLAFPRVVGCAGDSARRIVRLPNAGTDAAVITSLRILRSGPFRVITPASLPQIVGVGDDAQIVLQFEPRAAGRYFDTLVVTIAGCARQIRVPLSGVADSVGFDIVETTADFPSLVACVGESDTTITVRSTGSASVRIALDRDPGSGFSVEGLPMTLAAGQVQQLVVRFAPPAGPVTAQAMLRLVADVCGTVDSVLLRGERRPGAALEHPDSIGFGTIALCSVGTPDTTIAVDLVNASSEPVAIDVPVVGVPFAIVGAGAFPATIAPGARLSFGVRYSAATAGAALGTIAIPIDATGCRDTLRIPVGAAAATAVLAPTDTTISVGPLPDCVGADTIAVPVRNLSGIAVAIDSVASTPGIEHLRPTLAFTIDAAAEATLFVRLSPRQAGPFDERVVLYTRGCRDSIVVRVVGTKEGTVVVAEPPEINAPTLLSCALDSVVALGVDVRNSGEFPVRIRSARIVGSASFSLLAEITGLDIAPRGAIAARLRYAPLSVGVADATLEIVLEPCGDTLRVPLHGNVLAASLGTSGGVFPAVVVGSSSAARLVLRNDMPMALRIGSLGVPPAPFSFLTTPVVPIDVAPGDSVVLDMRFDPTTAGTYRLATDVNVIEPCSFVALADLSGEAIARTDTLGACLSGREAGIAGDIVELAIATDEHAPLASGESIEYTIDYDWRRLQFVDAPGATLLDDGVPNGALRIRLDGPSFGPGHARLRFRLISGTEPTTSVRIDSAVVSTGDVALSICADSAVVRIADRCVLVGVSLGRHANRLDASRPNPARDVVEIDFEQLEDAHTRLAIYDLEGREVLRAVDAQLAGGGYSVRVDVSALPAGTYLIRIAAGSYQDARLLGIER